MATYWSDLLAKKWLYVQFEKTPLGMKFKKDSNVVSSVVKDSQSEVLGVEPGWQLFGINDHDLTLNEISHLHETLQEAVKLLKSDTDDNAAVLARQESGF